MRLFVAIELAPPVRAAAVDLVADLRGRTAVLAPTSRVTWLTAERMHLTLAFIGERPDADVPVVLAAMNEAARASAFDATVEGLGAFPPRGRPRVLWAGVGPGADRLVELGSALSGALARRGLQVDERPLRPHLTLGRVREATGVRPAAIFAGLERQVLGTTPVDAITLFQSRLSPAGAEYAPLARCALLDAGVDPAA